MPGIVIRLANVSDASFRSDTTPLDYGALAHFEAQHLVVVLLTHVSPRNICVNLVVRSKPRCADQVRARAGLLADLISVLIVPRHLTKRDDTFIRVVEQS